MAGKAKPSVKKRPQTDSQKRRKPTAKKPPKKRNYPPNRKDAGRKGFSCPYYTDGEKRMALSCIKACGGKIMQASHLLGIPYHTLYEWQNNGNLNPDILTVQKLIEQDMADLYEGIARLVLGEIARPGKVEAAEFKDLIKGAGTATTMARLLRGQSTSIVGKEDLTDDERLNRLRGIVERAKARRLDEVAPAGSTSIGGIGAALPHVGTEGNGSAAKE